MKRDGQAVAHIILSVEVNKMTYHYRIVLQVIRIWRGRIYLRRETWTFSAPRESWGSLGMAVVPRWTSIEHNIKTRWQISLSCLRSEENWVVKEVGSKKRNSHLSQKMTIQPGWDISTTPVRSARRFARSSACICALGWLGLSSFSVSVPGN